MKKRRVVKHERALRDLELRSEYIRQHNPRAALKFRGHHTQFPASVPMNYVWCPRNSASVPMNYVWCPRNSESSFRTSRQGPKGLMSRGGKAHGESTHGP